MKKRVLPVLVACSLLGVVSSSLAAAGSGRGGMVSGVGRKGPQGISQVMDRAADLDAQQLGPGGRVGKPGSKGAVVGGGETLPPPPPAGPNADFSGLGQGQAVGNAYAAAGLVFTGATALDRFNGSGNPNPGIAYSPQGRMVIGFETLNASAVRFHYVSSVALTLTTHASGNGTGAALSTRTLGATVSGSPFSNWAVVDEVLPAGVKSVVLTGQADRWGLDAFGVATGCPAPVSSSDDCNGNGQSDACEIARGLVQDCNGNGLPDSCDISGGFFMPSSWTLKQNRLAGSGQLVLNGSYQVLETAAIGGSGTLTASDMRIVSGNSSSRGITWYSTVAQKSGYVHFNFTFIGTDRDGLGWDGAGYIVNGSFKVVTINAGPSSGLVSFWVNAGDTYGLGAATGDGGLGAGTGTFVVRQVGWAPDCNTNGIPDSCDLSSGRSVDRNGNGIPDECDPNPVLALTTNVPANTCTPLGASVQVEARLSGASLPVVAGQMLISWDPAKLSLNGVTAGDAPFNVVYSLNQAAGQVMVLASVAPGSAGEVVGNKAMARLNFTVVGASCDGSAMGVGFFGAGPMQTEFTDGQGNAFSPVLTGSAGFKVDDGLPVLSNVPADVTVRPEAGDGAFASVSLTAPTATDGCSPVTQTATRSDGQPLSAAYGVGTTTVTWTATDPCGNTTSATTRVTVEPYNTMSVDVSYAGSGFAASMTRTLSLSVLGSGGSASRTPAASFASGAATVQVTDLSIDTYSCVTVEDTARSLRRRATVTDGGANWTATASLVLGDIINDEVIDVLDWGAYVVRNPNADLDGNGVINSADGQFILNSFGVQGDGGCVAGLAGPPTAIESISVSDLVQMGLPELVGADLNGDGWLDLRDMGLAD